MIRKTERVFVKKINKIGDSYLGRQGIRRTTYWLLWIIPIFTKDEVVTGDLER